jgi:hypothetical protein
LPSPEDINNVKHLRRLTTDTAVNVAANLIAGSIAYLGAVSFGYLRVNPIALVISVAILALTLSAGLWAVGAFSNNYTQSVNGKRVFLGASSVLLTILLAYISAKTNAPGLFFLSVQLLAAIALLQLLAVPLFSRLSVFPVEPSRAEGLSHSVLALLIFLLVYIAI